MTRFAIRLMMWELLATFVMVGQETRGTLVGRVTDQTGAVIAGAQVAVENQATGFKSETTTNQDGLYQVRYLLPGYYQVSVSQPGFRTLVRRDIEIRISDRVELNLTLEVGAVDQRIEVVGETPLLETASASMGQVVDTRRIQELPLLHGNPMAVLELTPGLVQARTSNLGLWGGRVFDNAWTTSFSIDGAPPNTSEITLDGVSNTTTLGGGKSGGFQTVAYTPPADAVQEFKIQTASFDAATGYTSGSTINISVKGGTNQFHGTAYYFKILPELNANSWFGNYYRQPKPTFQYDRWGGSFNGPLRLPGLYKGTDRTFFSYGYEGHHDITPWAATVTVPTPKQLGGDFSDLLKVGANYQIYNPFSARSLPNGRIERDPFPGNIIPASMIVPMAKKASGYWAEPAIAGTADGGNNLPLPNQPDPNYYYSHVGRGDHMLSSANRLYARIHVSKNVEKNFNDYFKTDASGVSLFRRNRGLALDDVHVFSPTTVLNLRYGYTRFLEERIAKSIGFDLARLGFDPAVIATIDPRAYVFPRIDVSGYQRLGGENPSYNVDDTHHANAGLDWLRGRHGAKIGGEWRAYRLYRQAFGQAVPALVFGTEYTRGPLDTSAPSPRGQGLAAFLLGVPSNVYTDRNDSTASQSQNFGWYFQDDWKATSRLTLTLGLRWEYAGPVTERFNRSIRGYDFTVPSPIEAQVRANYARNPMPDVSPEAFRLTGGVRYAGANEAPRELADVPRTAFAPRIGLAWSLTPKTVLRAGYGLFFALIDVRQFGPTTYGYSQQTNVLPTLDGGLTFRIKDLGNPFVDGIRRPAGNSLGLMAQVGESVTVSFPDSKAPDPYMQRWQLSLQRELPGRVLLDAGYLGNRATRLILSRDWNALPNAYLSRLPVRDQATIDYLSQRFANPFYGVLTGTSLSGSVLTRPQFLKPYPHYLVFGVGLPQAYSWYHSLQTKVERRFANGFTFQLSWTWSKFMEATGLLNAGDPLPEEVLSSLDYPHRIGISGIYELPFGKGRRWMSAAPTVLEKIAGGWQVQGIYTAQSGPMLEFGNIFFYGDMKDVALPVKQRTVERWFNTDASFERNSARQPLYNYRVLSTRFAGVRGDGINQMNLSLLKNASLWERARFQFRLEAINALNHPMFRPPNTSVTSSAFGRVTAEKGSQRVIQLGFKMLF